MNEKEKSRAVKDRQTEANKQSAGRARPEEAWKLNVNEWNKRQSGADVDGGSAA